METINKRIKYIIEKKNFSVASFAEYIGVLQQTLNNYIIKDREPSISAVVKILKKFDDISGDWLLTGEGEILKHSISKEYINTNVGRSNKGVVISSGASSIVNNLHAEKIIKPNGTIELSNDSLEGKDIQTNLTSENEMLKTRILDLEERIKDKNQMIALYASIHSK